MRGPVLTALFALAAAACAPPSNAPAPDGSVVRSGVVRVVGSAPMNVAVAVQEPNGRSTYITGPLTREIGSASGAVVRVTGRMQGNYLEAASYVVESVNGQPVRMGIVERTTTGGVQLRTNEGDVILLVGAADRFRAGQKVWVQGISEPALRVQTYGVLTP